ncbi:DNA translocase FtsK [Desulfitobacterium sp.]|uniref:DNA translocase FtsK n=1 Tax=Desulfitobacterium sp. TaxID=49981 RepID=UPI002BA8C516|nr:DNA translocase FtsK [Desulfitobacterium sp.]HVJ48800.1 DNA translocase FtsK [Desulfitobacterium sp.]
MPKKQKSSRGKWDFVATLIGILGFLGIIGELEITGVGRSIYTGFKTVFGSIAWVGPLLFLLVMIVIEIVTHSQSRKQEVNSWHLLRKTEHTNRKRRKPIQKRRTNRVAMHEENKGMAIPKGKLVSLQGFEEYFASPEGPEIESAATGERLSELGRDFTTYFQEGQEFSFRTLGTKMTTLQAMKGFPSYFDAVQSEYEEELKKYARPDAGILIPEKRDWLSILKEDERRVPGQLAQLIRDLPQEESSNVQITPQEEKRTVQVQGEELSRVNRPETIPESTYLEPQSPIDDGSKLNIPNLIVNSPRIVGENEINVNSGDQEQVEIISKNDEVAPAISSEILTEVHDDCVDKPQLERAKPWSLPEFKLLDPVPNIPAVYDPEVQKRLEQVLADFGVEAKVIRVTRGPVITRFELAPAPGVKISRIVHLADDIALGLAARDVRIEAPIPGKAAIGIEVPNKQPRPVPFREVLETSTFQENPSKLKTALGKDISNQPVIADLAKMPHVLIAGATGSGKSVCITSLINSILFNAQPNEVKFLMVDPKMVELSIYNGIPHLLAPVVTDPKKAAAALKWVVKEMETRYELFAAAGVRDIERYNRQKASSDEAVPALPWIVVIIDELADLMMVAANEVEEAICRLAQMARAAGIHLVIATQRPSVDVITGVIKANIPSRISFAVSSQIDSRTILDTTGAEKLLGRGDMLYSPQGLNKPIRVQGCFVADDEVQRIIDYWKAQGKPEYLDPEGFLAEMETKNEGAGPDDELFVDAGRMIMNTGMASVSFLQRKFKLGYARAARLIDLLEDNGVVGGYEGSKPRQILMTKEEFEERFG